MTRRCNGLYSYAVIQLLPIFTYGRNNPKLKFEMETPYFKMRREGDIICCEYTDNLHLTLEIAKDPLLVDMRGIRSVTKEARTYMASVGPILVKAGALIIGSVINRTNGNVFLAIDKPSRGCQTLHGRSQSKGMAAEIYPDKLAEKEKEHPS